MLIYLKSYYELNYQLIHQNDLFQMYIMYLMYYFHLFVFLMGVLRHLNLCNKLNL